MKKETGVVSIRGKDYKTVALRVEEFRAEHPIDANWSITTELLQCDSDGVLIKAIIITPEGTIVATGHAQESWTGTINKTSAVENCETSAIGRALAAAGLAGQEFASANEVQRAMSQQAQGHTNRPPSKEAVTMSQLKALRDAWKAKNADAIKGADSDGMRAAFVDWVKGISARQADWNCLDPTQWRVEDMARCWEDVNERE